MMYLGIFLACGCGAMLRYGLAQGLQNHPKGGAAATLLANLLACFLLGCFSTAVADPTLYQMLATGFCGGLSTFSTLQADLTDKDKPASWILVWLPLSYGLGWLFLLAGQRLVA